MNSQNHYNDKHWKTTIKQANKAFSQGEIDRSLQSSKMALAMAQQLFVNFKGTNPLPEGLTATLVISYLNIADCWGAQHKKKEQIMCLVEIYDYLKIMLHGHPISKELSHQLYGGASKVYLELCACLQEINAQEIIKTTRKDFEVLSALYQVQTYTIH